MMINTAKVVVIMLFAAFKIHIMEMKWFGQNEWKKKNFFLSVNSPHQVWKHVTSFQHKLWTWFHFLQFFLFKFSFPAFSSNWTVSHHESQQTKSNYAYEARSKMRIERKRICLTVFQAGKSLLGLFVRMGSHPILLKNGIWLKVYKLRT